ncbi:hypothetical protein HD599_003217 [Conyzicola lurida]|uniref:Uncharacterized protein n=1 Tax=Conyzicola lurida TaxID=1172621 RepID=A0A841ARJ2_9MICO|nr:hypothetical protein [Conyzicola lurida]MBB5844894.1 hypothetical protein [Conyzicola lurida]
MGRDKLKKPKKQPKAGAVDLSAIVGEYDREGLWTLLLAAGASPTVRRRWSSIGFLVHAFARAHLSGSKPTAPETTFGKLLAAVDAANPGYSAYEDYLAPDPRLAVRVRIGDSTIRLFPGSSERPVADVDRALLLSSALDAKLVGIHGFGIADLLDVVLGYVDLVTERFAVVWPGGELPDGSTSLTAAELDVARKIFELGTPKQLVSNDRQKLALEWMTSEVSDFDFEPGHAQSPFGRFLRFRAAPDESPRWLPLAFLPEILSSAVGELAKTISKDSASNFAFAQASASATREYLWRFAHMLYGPPDLSKGPAVSPENVVQWVIPLGEQLTLAVQVLSGMDADRIGFREDFAVSMVARKAATGSGVTVKFPRGEVHLDRGVEVVPLLVVSTPDHIIVPQRGGLASVSLDDLRWMSTSADSEFDLLNFCRDVSSPAMTGSIGYEAIDYWETWRDNGKAFFTGAHTGAIMVIEPHASGEEWKRTAEWTSAEQALAVLGLPALRETIGVSHAREAPVAVYRWVDAEPDLDADDIPRDVSGRHFRPAPAGWSVHTGPIPVAISAGDATRNEREHRQLLHDMAGSIGFAVEAVLDEWTAAHDDSGIAGYVLDQVIREESAAETGAQWVSDVTIDDRGIVHATVNVHFERFAELGDGDSPAIRSEFATWMKELLVESGISQAKTERVFAAVLAAPPTMTLNVAETQTRRNNLGAAVEIDDAFVSTANRMIAERVKAAGVVPKLYEGDEAKTLDRDVLAAIALELLEERLSEYSSDKLVAFGMEQLQRTVDNSARKLENVRRSARELSLSWDPVDRAAQTHAQGHVLRRYNEIVVEAALRSAPSGDKIMDEPAWGGILAAAKAYLEATARSESIHYQVTPTAIKISDLFEITIQDVTLMGPAKGGRNPYQLNGAEYSEAIIREGFEDDWPESAVPASLHEAVDVEMLAAFGATSLDIYATLLSLAGIEYAPGDTEVKSMSVDQMLAWVLSNTTLGEEESGEARVTAALALLTSTGEGLRKDDWRPWLARTRLRRLLVQPLPTLSTGEVLVAPHFLLSSLKVFGGYLNQGQLPWSQPAPPVPLERALERFRDAKNTALEKDVVALLVTDGWSVVSNIKETKPKRLGLTSLSTEIDAVAGRAGDSVIHLLEAKDPANVFAIPQISRQLDDFYLDGKKNAYATQLQRKYDDLAPHADKVAAALGLPPRDATAPYRVEATFVTRVPVPAAFVGGPFPFLTAATLLDGLKAKEH